MLLESDKSGDIRDTQKSNLISMNKVKEYMFQAALLIAQNIEVDGSEPLLKRIVHEESLTALAGLKQ